MEKFYFIPHLIMGDYKYIESVLAGFAVQPGYSVNQFRYGRDDQVESNLLLVVLLGLLLIYIVTAALYESFRDPLLIFLTIPSAFIGIVLIFFMFDLTFDHSAYIGALFISGIVVNNSIILISRFRANQKKGHSVHQSVMDGTMQHLRPVFLTSATTLLGFLPMVILTDQAAGDIWFSLAITGIGGMITSFLFIVWVLPALYYIIENGRYKEKSLGRFF